MCLNTDLLNSTQAIIGKLEKLFIFGVFLIFFTGVPLRELVERFGLQIIQLFKLVLLQKRVLFFHSPVRPLSTAILSLLALFPGLVETGLDSATALATAPEASLGQQNSETKLGGEQTPTSPGNFFILFTIIFPAALFSSLLREYRKKQSTKLDYSN